MSKIAIVTDSVASIPDPMIEKLNIHTVAYYIHRGQEVLRDLVTIKRDEFFTWMKGAKEIPQTASPGPGDYLTLYEKLASEGTEDIISIHMSSKGSGAYQAARAALPMLQERLPKMRVEVIDTLNVSMCQGWIALEAARAVLEDKSVSEILDTIYRLIPITKMIQTADTLKYLYLGGRIGKAKHLVGSLLNIKPLISMENGLVVALGTARSQIKAYQSMAEMVEKSADNRQIKIAYVHAAAKDEIERLREEIESRIQVVESFVTELSPALGVHSGPGTTGLCFYPVNK
ncbi:MAG: DegV family protein [Chloroflexi bacterium]|nr:DegV family protein [Chloroflexota bacterium]